METPDVDQIERLVAVLKDALKDGELTTISLEQDDFMLRLEKEHPAAAPLAPVYPSAPPPPAVPFQPNPAPAGVGSGTVAEPVDEPGIAYVKSPMVGTFYRAPSPESEPYVDSGTAVKADSVVCIIEAMKVMNEIQAEISGTVEEILVENGTPVEYGQRLIKVRQS